MDEALLTFDREQLKLYTELVETCECGERVNVPTADTKIFEALPCPNCREKMSVARDKAIRSARTLLDHRIDDAFFSHSYSREEILRIRKQYYRTVDELSRLRSVLCEVVLDISRVFSELEDLDGRLSGAYSAFLPYRAALSEISEYSEAVSLEDGRFHSAFSRLEERRRELSELLTLAETVDHDIVGEFLTASASAAGSPSFESFSEGEFFTSVRALIARLEAVEI